ncbi:MAG: hypothetical protein ACREFJ_08295 [Acetobacteraceae bacterium]
MSRERLAAWSAGAPDSIRWIVRNKDSRSDWARKVEVPACEIPFVATDAVVQLPAVRLGLGMAALSCFVADADPLLARVPGSAVRLFGTLWLLTQGDARKTKRVRIFTTFVARRLAMHAPVPAGGTYTASEIGGNRQASASARSRGRTGCAGHTVVRLCTAVMVE